MTFPGQIRFCKACRRPLARGATAAYCDAPTCQTRAKMDEAAAMLQRRSAYEAEVYALAQKRAADAVTTAKERLCAIDPDLDPDAIQTEIVPFVDRGQIPVPEERRAAFTEHLDDILHRGFAYGPPSPFMRGWEIRKDDDPAYRQSGIDEDALALVAACVACQGKCCFSGRKTWGFLTERTVRTVRAATPDITQEALRQKYLDLIPDTSMRKSCLFHGAEGCTLPRELRSGVCNRFECSHRKRFRAKLDKNGTGYGIAVGVAEDHARTPEAGADVIRVVTAGADGLGIQDDLRPGPMPATPPRAHAAARSDPAPSDIGMTEID